MGTVRCTKAGEISISGKVYIEVSSAPIVQLLCRHPSSGILAVTCLQAYAVWIMMLRQNLLSKYHGRI